jgi:hypothetical protein
MVMMNPELENVQEVVIGLDPETLEQLDKSFSGTMTA